MHSFCNILNTKANILKSIHVKSLLVPYEKQISKFNFSGSDLLSLKILIYSVGKQRNMNKEFQLSFVKNIIGRYITTGKYSIILINYLLAAIKQNWPLVNTRAITEIVYIMSKLQMYTEIDTFNKLFAHIRPNLKKLNNQDLSLLIWSLTKIYAWHFNNQKMDEMVHSNFGVEKSILMLVE